MSDWRKDVETAYYGNSTWGYSSSATYTQPITFYYDQVTGAAAQYGQSPMPKIHIPVQAEVVPETPMEWLQRRVAEVTDLAGIEI